MIFENLPMELRYEIISFLESKCITCKKRLLTDKKYFDSDKYTFCSTKCVSNYFVLMSNHPISL